MFNICHIFLQLGTQNLKKTWQIFCDNSWNLDRMGVVNKLGTSICVITSSCCYVNWEESFMES